ncbi:hypothetical protein ABK040_001119 [Willaertia magna]
MSNTHYQDKLNSTKQYINQTTKSIITRGTASIVTIIPLIKCLGFPASVAIAKSIATTLISKYAVAKGGAIASGIVTGSVFSILQSVVATSTLSPVGLIGVFLIGGVSGYYCGVKNIPDKDIVASGVNNALGKTNEFSKVAYDKTLNYVKNYYYDLKKKNNFM